MSGAAIAKVHLYANSAAAGFPPAILTRTDANGTFCLEKLDPGAYSLIAQRAGYLDAVYKSSRFSAGPSSLTVAPGKALSPLTITMTPRPILTGLVVDIDGNPAINVEVSATETQGAGIRRSPGNLTLTDAKGRFRFYDLDPGSYFLVASPAARVSFFSGNYRGSNGEPLGSRPVETFYPAATRSADATSIELKAGSEVTGITITMQTTLLRHVSGKVIGAFRGYLMLNTDLPNGHSEGMAVPR